MVDFLVIGAGVIGAAVAERLSRQHTVVVLEKFSRIAEGVTSRNSGVIHSALYYPPKSLKAKLCLRGKSLMYEWLEKKNLPHARIGKLIVATNLAEQEELENIYQNALMSEASGIEKWSQTQIHSSHPHFRIPGTEAIFAKETGIVDPFEFTKSLLQQAEEQGALALTDAGVTKILVHDGGWTVETSRGPIDASFIINCAGLHADDIAAMCGTPLYKIHPCRGDYFRLRSEIKFSSLIYPVKAKGDSGLGIHLTLDLAGNMKLGPDTEYVTTKDDFSSREEKLEKFRVAAEKILGPLKAEQLSFDQCGIRPKLRAPTEAAEKDFVISKDLPNLINLVGIESPGLTASLAIAEYVESLI